MQPTGLVQPKGFVQPKAASSYCRCVVASALLSLVATVLHLGGCRFPVGPCVLTGRPCCCSTIALAIVGGGVPVLLLNLLALSGFFGHCWQALRVGGWPCSLLEGRAQALLECPLAWNTAPRTWQGVVLARSAALKAGASALVRLVLSCQSPRVGTCGWLVFPCFGWACTETLEERDRCRRF